MLKRLARPIWHRRHLAIHFIKRFFMWLFATLNTLPLPEHIKKAVRDVVMLCVSAFIVHTRPFQQWQREAAGTSRIQHLLIEQGKDSSTAALPLAPTKEAWDTLEAEINPVSPEEAAVIVIIPVYSGYDQSLNTIYTALATRAHNTQPYHVVVIDDASPDTALSQSLLSLANRGLFELRVNDENLGFVKTVNKGMQLYPNQDVLLLNADTEVYNNWVDKILASAAANPEAATITPFSNNAEICSYPYFVQDNNMQLETSYAELDALAAEVNKAAVVEVPTGVGFCMYIARNALNACGLFDEVHFGKGYGEENEFCRRTAAAGWSHLMLCDTFVRHIGGTSFGANKKKLVLKNYDVLCSLYPDYPQLVKQFLRDDPVKAYRRNLDIARLNRQLHAQNVLMVNHQMGGGTERHVRELAQALNKEKIGSVVLNPVTQDNSLICLKAYGVEFLPNLVFSLEHDQQAFIETLRALRINHLHIHHLVNFPPRIHEFLQIVMQTLQLKYDVTLHDYYSFCPRINLINGDNRYCGEPEISECERCISVNHSHAAGMPVWLWRNRFDHLLKEARKVFVPSEDAKSRISRHFPEVNFIVRPHEEAFDNARLLDIDKQPGQRLKIVIIGAISVIKGSDLLAALVEDANKRDLPVEYVLVGHTDNHRLNAGLNRFEMTGQYKEEEISKLLRDAAPHLAFIPSIWPETYCYTLSIAWRHGIKPVVFDIGAQAERIRDIGEEAGEILPYKWIDKPERINDWFANYQGHIASVAAPKNQQYDSYITEYYEMDERLSA